MASNEGKKIRDFWKPKNEISRVNERHIRKALKTADIEEHSISYFLYLPEYKPHHNKVLKALKLKGG
jgi:hypothetical protein